MSNYGILPINDDSIQRAISLIRAGEVVVIPTDTVYGVVADPCNEAAVRKIFEVKHRPRSKTVQILLSDLSQASHFGIEFPQEFSTLERAFMPGPVSLIGEVKAAAQTAAQLQLATVRTETDGRFTQAVRLPDNPVSMHILEATGPLAASSANRSGLEAASTAQQAYEKLGDSVSLYLDGGATPGPVASTVVAWNTQTKSPVIVREGVISEAEICSVLA